MKNKKKKPTARKSRTTKVTKKSSRRKTVVKQTRIVVADYKASLPAPSFPQVPVRPREPYRVTLPGTRTPPLQFTPAKPVLTGGGYPVDPVIAFAWKAKAKADWKLAA